MNAVVNSPEFDEIERRSDLRFELKFPLEKSVRYHEMRQAFYARVDKFIKVATLSAGSASVLLLVKQAGDEYGLYMAAAASVLTLLNLVFKTSELATQHAQFKQKFLSLLVALEKIESNSSDFDAELKAIRAERRAIEKDEPPKFCYVDIRAHNETCRALDSEELWGLPWYRGAVANWVRGSPSASYRKKTN